MKKKKEYCVHIYPKYHEYENIMAETPEKAELIAVKRHSANDYDDIDHVEVMRVHQCDKDQATDNDPVDKNCSNCGKKL